MAFFLKIFLLSVKSGKSGVKHCGRPVEFFFKKYTKLATLAFLPTLCSHNFAVCCFVGTV